MSIRLFLLILELEKSLFFLGSTEHFTAILHLAVAAEAALSFLFILNLPW
jgi:hypothetical protein